MDLLAIIHCGTATGIGSVMENSFLTMARTDKGPAVRTIHDYSIIVDNVGQVFGPVTNGAQALREYGQWIESSKSGKGRAGNEAVTLTRDNDPWREYRPPSVWFFEVTDTFGGDANYCWVNRYKVTADNFRMALIKFGRAAGYTGRMRKDWDSGDFARYNIDRACICFFVSAWEDSRVEYHRVEIVE